MHMPHRFDSPQVHPADSDDEALIAGLASLHIRQMQAAKSAAGNGQSQREKPLARTSVADEQDPPPILAEQARHAPSKRSADGPWASDQADDLSPGQIQAVETLLRKLEAMARGAGGKPSRGSATESVSLVDEPQAQPAPDAASARTHRGKGHHWFAAWREILLVAAGVAASAIIWWLLG